jgi:arsenate reductase-like glutaredoxin family protein
VQIAVETKASAKLGAAKAREMVKSAAQVIVMKGRKVDVFDLERDKPAEKELLAVMLGSTGNLRAPTIVCGKTVLVGFNQEVYDEVLG